MCILWTRVIRQVSLSVETPHQPLVLKWSCKWESLYSLFCSHLLSISYFVLQYFDKVWILHHILCSPENPIHLFFFQLNTPRKPSGSIYSKDLISLSIYALEHHLTKNKQILCIASVASKYNESWMLQQHTRIND